MIVSKQTKINFLIISSRECYLNVGSPTILRDEIIKILKIPSKEVLFASLFKSLKFCN